MRYDYLLIDNDNTLMDFDRAEGCALREALAAFQLPHDDATCEVYAEMNAALWKALERGEIIQKELLVERFRQLLAYLRVTSVEAQALCNEYNHDLGRHAELLDGALDFMEQVHGKMKIALVSNGVSSIQRDRLARCAYTPMLDAVIISEEVGASKPRPEIVDMALRALGCEDRTRAVLMGDSLTADIAAARAARLDSIWYAPGEQTSDAPTYTVRSFEEAKRLLLG